MKHCPRCGEDKPETKQYWYADSKAKDGLQGYCKACKADIHRIYMSDAETGKRVRAKVREWQKGIGKEKYHESQRNYGKSLKRKIWRHARTENARSFAEFYVRQILKVKEVREPCSK